MTTHSKQYDEAVSVIRQLEKLEEELERLEWLACRHRKASIRKSRAQVEHSDRTAPDESNDETAE